MTTYRNILMLLLTLGLSGFIIHAQGRTDLSNVYVTTQDYANLRLGPGKNWDVLAKLDYGVTLKATGRSVDSRWIQVMYEGDVDNDSATIDGVTYGWITYWVLVWTGDILELPIDGVETIRSARQSGPLITIGPETRYYVDGIHPSTRVTDTVDSEQTVEVTGRIGSASAGYFWIQFEHNNQFYWTATWETGVPTGYRGVADGSAVFPYGRLLTQIQQTVNANTRNWNTISRRWRDLDGGFQTTCNNIPPLTTVRSDFFKPGDLELETEFASAVVALDSLIENMNAATTLFTEVCNRAGGGRFATAEDVDEAINYLDEADRQWNIVQLFLTPLERRNPLLGGNG